MRGGAGGQGLPRYGGIGGDGGSVSVVAKKNVTLTDVFRQNEKKRFVAGVGGNSRYIPWHMFTQKCFADQFSVKGYKCMHMVFYLRFIINGVTYFHCLKYS